MTADIQGADHVARCCTKRKQEDDGTPAPGAFELKDDDRGCLSVNWLEYFGEKTVADNIPHARKELNMHYKTKKSYRLAVLNVGVAKRAVKEALNVDISVRSDPRDNHRSHACVGGYAANNSNVATMLSEIVRECDTYPAV